MSGARAQINVRLSQELIELLDKKRISLQPELGRIPTRSDVIRLALEDYLRRDEGDAEKANRR